mgnify:CR=1 FL=1|tara:strand:- start:64819 stop:65247 length:429 start_codon:yes stop_codon:yes gene_type:complete
MKPVTHFEIPFDDAERAKQFYSTVFNWKIGAVPDMQYHFVCTTESDEKTGMPLKPGAINGGMYKRCDVSSKHPVPVVMVPNTKEYVDKVTAAGGSLVGNIHQVGNMGIYAQVKDSEGNIIGLWETLKGEECDIPERQELANQ